MTVRPIVQIGDQVLRTPGEPVTEFDDALQTLVADMVESMHAADGVGLAAHQIGVPLRVFVFDCPDADGVKQRGVVVNPVLDDVAPEDRRLDEDLEGCLSIHGQHAHVARLDEATVRGVDDHGRPVVVHGTGLLARCLQHETDHLDGRLYIDRLRARERRALLDAYAAGNPDDVDDAPF